MVSLAFGNKHMTANRDYRYLDPIKVFWWTIYLSEIPLKSVYVPLICANNEYTRHCCIKFLELSQDMLF